MRLTKQTKCEDCGAIIKQHAIAEVLTRPDKKNEKHAISKCAACGHLQDLELVPEFVWTQWTPGTMFLIDRNTFEMLYSVSRIFTDSMTDYGYADNQHFIGIAPTLEAAKSAVEDLLNGVTL